MADDKEWPKHQDGSPMKIGEMLPAQRRHQFVRAIQKVKTEFEHPAMQEKMAALLRGETIQ
jgi:hypothetical protein